MCPVRGLLCNLLVQLPFEEATGCCRLLSGASAFACSYRAATCSCMLSSAGWLAVDSCRFSSSSPGRILSCALPFPALSLPFARSQVRLCSGPLPPQRVPFGHRVSVDLGCREALAAGHHGQANPTRYSGAPRQPERKRSRPGRRVSAGVFSVVSVSRNLATDRFAASSGGGRRRE